jgi:hypothetical protein
MGTLHRECGLLSAKGGLMMGTKKVGILSSPPKRTILNIQEIKSIVKRKIKKILFFLIETKTRTYVKKINISSIFIRSAYFEFKKMSSSFCLQKHWRRKRD